LKDESKRRLKGESRGHAGVVKGIRKKKKIPIDVHEHKHTCRLLMYAGWG